MQNHSHLEKKIKQKARVRKQTRRPKSKTSGTLSRQVRKAELQSKTKKAAKVNIRLNLE
jgi:hypothetical protein